MFFYPVTYTVIAAQCKNPKSTFIQCLNEDEKKTADAFFLFLVHPIQIDYVRVCVCACVRAYVCVCVRVAASPIGPPPFLLVTSHNCERKRERQRQQSNINSILQRTGIFLADSKQESGCKGWKLHFSFLSHRKYYLEHLSGSLAWALFLCAVFFCIFLTWVCSRKMGILYAFIASLSDLPPSP